MTEQRAKEMLQQIAYDGEYPMGSTDAFNMAIKALEEIQQYRALGLTPELIEAMQGHNIAMINDLAEYQALGTVEELRVARDKQIEKKPIYKEMPYSEEVGFNEEWHCPVCGAYVGYYTEGMGEPEQMEYCNECGQHIARDWSDEE